MSLLLRGRTGYTDCDCFVMAAGRRMLGYNQGQGSWTPAAMTRAKEQFDLDLTLLNAGHLREPSPPPCMVPALVTAPVTA